MTQMTKRSMDMPARDTVIVPLYNDSDNLNRCLTALVESIYEYFDVLVIDNDSTETIKPLMGCFGYRHFRIDEPGGGGVYSHPRSLELSG